nr:MAG TPA: hypothetical protein [Caudoviricetes sp.]
MAFYEDVVDVSSGLDARRQVMDSWDVDTMELYNVLRADAVASGCSEADGSSYAYDVIMSLSKS